MKHPMIEISPEIMVGKPAVRGTRVTVEHILRRLPDYGMLPDCLGDHPSLTVDDVRAALAYAAIYQSPWLCSATL